jgi:methanogenic corrinoid protein MtbC1
MSDEEVYQEVIKVLSDPATETHDEMKGLTLCMLEMNEEEFDNIFERQVIRKGFLRTITEVIYPFLEYVGVLWTTNKAMVAQEHFISNLIRQKLISAIERLALPSKEAPSIVFFLTEGEEHEIGLLLASFMAKSMGWRVYYLGQGVPLINIKKVIDMAEPRLIMSMFVTPKANKINQFVDAVLEGNKISYIVSGSHENMAAITDSDRVLKVSSPNEFENHLSRMYEARIF